MVKLDSGIRRFDTVFVVALLFLFTITASLLVLVSAKQYNITTREMNSNYQSRTISSYLREKIRQSDINGEITVEDENQIACIKMVQSLNGNNYITYIYAYEGNLYESFLKEGVDLSPASGQKIMPISTFAPQIDEHNDLIVNYRTEDGQFRHIVVNLISLKGDATNE